MERITKVSLMGYTIVARERALQPDFGPNHEITVGVRAAIRGEEGARRVDHISIIAALGAMPFVTSATITDPNGHGIEWP